MERQPGNVPYEAGRQAISLSDQCSSHPDKRAVQPNPTQAMEPAKSKENPSRQHLKILCRKENVWIDVMGVLSTGIEDNWIGGHALNRSGPQPRTRIPEGTYIDTQGGHFSATETVTICWRAVNGSYIDEGEFRVMENGPFDIILGSKLLFSRGIYTFNEHAPLFYYKKENKENEMRTLERSSVQQRASSSQIHGNAGSYEAFGRGSSSAGLTTGVGDIDKPRPTSSTKLEPWICSYCAEENSPARDTGWRCTRCGNDHVGAHRY